MSTRIKSRPIGRKLLVRPAKRLLHPTLAASQAVSARRLIVPLPLAASCPPARSPALRPVQS